MAYDARQIANWFIGRAARDGRCLSIMSLLKLTYIAHGWHLEVFDRPLISNRIEAWQYGPVIPDVYNSMRHQGVSVTQPLEGFPPPAGEEETSFLEQIFRIYGHMPAFRLSDITHVPGGPWDTAWKIAGRFAPIPDQLIRDHYVAKRADAERAEASAKNA